MKFLSVLTLIFVPLAASAAIISGNDVFNDPTQSLDVFVCYGYLSAQGYKTLGDLPRYPYVTASTLVRSPYSPYCGTCFGFTYENKTIYAMVIDTAITWRDPSIPFEEDYFTTSTTFLNDLTDGQFKAGEYFERLAVQVDKAYCGPAHHTDCASC